MFGLENIDFGLGQTNRYLSDNFRIFNVPKYVFGEKILENSVKLIDNSIDDIVYINDDGHGNLIAGTNLFSKQQEIGNFDNLYETGSIPVSCPAIESVAPAEIPSGLTILGASSDSIDMQWAIGTELNGRFNVYRSSGSSAYIHYANVPYYINLYSDTNISQSITYNYYVTKYNSFGETTGSNIVTATI